jgi:hypothetical protein
MSKAVEVRETIPAEIRALWGEPPLLATENLDQYYALVIELVREVGPTDCIEWLWVKDIADLTWDVLRYRRMKVRPQPCEAAEDAEDANVSKRSIFDFRLAQMVGPLEALERILASVEIRRNNALREIERRRSALGRALRETSDRLIEGEAPLVPSIA